jgi:AcrR family transcriptional regulator
VTQVTQASKSAGAPRRRMAAPDRRLAILDAARSAFAEGGFHQTSLDAVAEQAGVSKALIYEHFASKRELYQAMLEMHVEELIERIGGAVMAADEPEQRMLAGLEAFFGFVEERRGAWRILFRNPGDPDVAVYMDRLRDGVAAAVVALMSEKATRAFPDVPERERIIEMTAQQLVGAMQSLADWWDLHPEVSREQVIQGAMDFAWSGQERLSRGLRWEPGKVGD